MAALSVAASATLVACKKDSTPAGPRAPSSTADQDALWALAPEGARVGVIASAHGLAMLERGALALEALIDSAPELEPVRHQLAQALSTVGAAELRLREFGLDPRGGAAMFLVGESDGVAILPVADRDVFLAKVRGRRGADHDELGNSTCKTVSGRYICARRPELFAKLGRGDLIATLRAAGARGDLEIVARELGPEIPTFSVVAQLERGAVVVRGAVAGMPSSVTGMLGSPSQPRSGAAAASGFGVLELTPLLATLPPVPIAEGITLADLARSVSGPVTFAIAGGTTDPDIRIPLRDPAPAKAIVERCTDLPPLAAIGATVKDGACRVPIPAVQLVFDSWVEGNQLRIGNRSGGTPVALTPTPLAEELAAGQWSIAFFGRGSFLDLSLVPAAAAALQGVSAEDRPLLRALPLFNELGIALRGDGDTVRFVIGVRTAWANSDDVAQKLLAITPDQITSGKAADIARSIAAGAPGSPFAHDLKAGVAGMMGLAAPIGALASLAIPAFMDYMRRSQQPPPAAAAPPSP
jgi:hypothetical protein